MNSIDSIKPEWDSTFSLMLELQKKNIIEYIYPNSLFLENKKVLADSSRIEVFKNKKKYFKTFRKRIIDLNKLNCILFRTNPPVDTNYIQTTYLLDQVEINGSLVINSPQSLRDYNEKLLGLSCSDKKIPTITTSKINFIKNFIDKYKKVVVKPLNLMAGKSISLVKSNDKNIDLILKKMTNNGDTIIVAQKFINEIKNGDTRIIIFNGKIYDKVLVRYPPENEFRANLAFGGKFKIKNISLKQKKYLKYIAEYLRSNRIYLAGLDMIGDYITEINITSPSGVSEINKATNNDLSKKIVSEFIKIIKESYV